MTTLDQLSLPLTGAQVREIRERYKLSRRELTDMCHFKAAARLLNIERNDSWKPGDQETLLAVLQQLLTDPPKDKRGRIRGQSAQDRIDRLEAMQRTNGSMPPEPATGGDEDTPPVATYQPLLDENFTDGLVLPDLDEFVHPSQLINDYDYDDAGVSFIPTDDPHVLRPLKLLSNSEVADWNRCRRRWWLTWFRELQLAVPDITSARSTGNRVHRALAAWYVPEGQDRVDPRDALERAIVEDWTALTADSQLSDEQLSHLASTYADATALERAMVEGYFEWLTETGADVNFEVIASETALSHDLMVDMRDGTELPVRLLAKLDVRVKRVSDGARLFVDHKTVQNFAEPRKTLHMDPQMLHYHLLEFLNTAEGEERCDAALYNMLRKVKRSAQAKPPFFDRIEQHHNVHEIKSYRKRVLGAARDIMQAERALAAGADHLEIAYPTPGRDCSFMCDFFAICPMFDDGSRVEDAISSLYRTGDPLARYGDADVND